MDWPLAGGNDVLKLDRGNFVDPRILFYENPAGAAVKIALR